jgi:UDP-N-acetylmuramate dehydrogenase
VRSLGDEITFNEQELKESIKGLILFDASMRKHTTFQIGGPARILIIPKNIQDIQKSVLYAKMYGLRIRVIGNGSKLLVSDNGISGLVIKISDTFDNILVSDDKLIAGAGCHLSRLIGIATSHALSGLEFAAGIPGTLGGAIVMNAGTSLGSMSEIINKVEAIDLDSVALKTFSKEDCQFHYRSSIFQEKNYLITCAELKLVLGNKNEIIKKMNESIEKRLSSQPLDKPNAGSIFKNPEGYSAAKLIDSAGLKGVRIGQAQVSDKHANFIVNLGNATAKDIFAIINLIQAEIKRKYHISLNLEIAIFNDDK